MHSSSRRPRRKVVHENAHNRAPLTVIDGLNKADGTVRKCHAAAALCGLKATLTPRKARDPDQSQDNGGYEVVRPENWLPKHRHSSI